MPGEHSLHPTISIAGREWVVPLLAPRQNRIVVPGLMKLAMLATADYGLLCEIVFAALTRAHPFLSREEFEAWPVPLWELVQSLPVISRQTGMMRTKRDGVAKMHVDLPDWDAIIAQFVNFLPGTTPDYWEDALTVPRLEAMNEEWRLHPPAAVLIAGFLGYKPRPRNLDAIEELMRLFPSGNLRLN